MMQRLLCAAVLLSVPAFGAPAGAEDGRVSNTDGLALESADGTYRVRVSGYVHFDGRFYTGDDADSATNTFLIRRARPVLQGTVAKYFEFFLMADFADTKIMLQDAYVDFRYTTKARLRFGKFKAPVGLERLRSASSLLFTERAFPTGLVPNRDIGVQLHGELIGGRVEYAAGIFNGAGNGGSSESDTSDSKDGAVRLFFRPFRKAEKSPLAGLGFGVAGTTGKQTGALAAQKTMGQQQFLSYASSVVADGTRKRIAPQLSYTWHRFGLLAEYVRAQQWIKNETTRAEIHDQAWQAAAGVVLTGEGSGLGAVKPKRSFDPKNGGWGAFELVGRVSRFEADQQAFDLGLLDPTKSARKANELGVGLNWYFNNNVRQMVDYEHTTFEGGVKNGDRKTENAIMLRWQVGF